MKSVACLRLMSRTEDTFKQWHSSSDVLTKMTTNAPPTKIRSLSKRRARYTKRRLEEMRLTVPDLPDSVLSHSKLRDLSFAVRKSRGGAQSTLQSSALLLLLPSPENSASFSTPGQ